MSIETPYPSKQEAETLAALVPRNNSNILPLEDFLRQLIRFCQRQDVCSFLFNKEPFQLTHLSNSNLERNAVTGLLTATRVENNTTRFFSDHIRSFFLMTPVFATDNVNFGFGVHESVYNPAMFWDTLNPGFFGRFMSRFVRDDSTGIMVIAMDFPGTDEIRVDFSQLIKTTGQIHSQAVFRRSELHTIYESGIFDLTSLTTALISFEAAYQIRECPFCRTKEKCNCSMPRVIPRHPFDIDAFYTNMERRLGTFQGAAAVSMYTGGKQVQGAAVGTRCTISGGIDPNLIDRLQRWAICESAIESDPRHSLINNAIGYANNVSGLSPNVAETSPDPPMHDGLPWLDLDGDWYGNPSASQERVTAEVIDDVSNEAQFMQAQSLIDATLEQANVMTTDVTDVSQGTTPRELPDNTLEGRTSSSGSRSQVTGATTSIKKDSNNKELVKKLRAELRKERNRASAQRSNLRKKAETDAKKLEIKTNKEKASLLRAKEMMLRKENMRLRELVAKKEEGSRS